MGESQGGGKGEEEAQRERVLESTFNALIVMLIWVGDWRLTGTHVRVSLSVGGCRCGCMVVYVYVEIIIVCYVIMFMVE